MCVYHYICLYMETLHKVRLCTLVLISTIIRVCRRGAVRLGMSKVTQVEFLPKEMVSYSKETQTPTEAATHTEQKAGKTETQMCVLFSESEIIKV